jgi:hypothetical protein
MKVETDDPSTKALIGLIVTFAPLLASGPMCPYSKYVLTNGVETRVFVGARHDN